MTNLDFSANHVKFAFVVTAPCQTTTTTGITNNVRMVAEQWIIFIRKHEADVTEKLMKQKDAFEAEFSNQMWSLDGRVVEIESSLNFGLEILSRKNLPEILDVEEMLENRLQELSVPFKPTLVFPDVVVTTCELHTQ